MSASLLEIRREPNCLIAQSLSYERRHLDGAGVGEEVTDCRLLCRGRRN